MPAPIISFIAGSGHGKTTVIEKLIPILCREGLRVGTIKHHVHDFTIDQPGKDTYRHKQAGAHTTALASPTGLAVIKDVEKDLSPTEITSLYFHDLDLVLTEGYKSGSIPKIEVFRKSVSPCPLKNRNHTWLAFVSNDLIDGDLPVFSPDDLSKLADFLINRFLQP